MENLNNIKELLFDITDSKTNFTGIYYLTKFLDYYNIDNSKIDWNFFSIEKQIVNELFNHVFSTLYYIEDNQLIVNF